MSNILSNNKIMRSIKKFTITCPYSVSDKMYASRALRNLTKLDLKESIEVLENPNVNQTFLLVDGLDYSEIEGQFRILENSGIKIQETVFTILEELRGLAKRALENGEDELSNDILNCVITEKSRRQKLV